MHFMKTFFVFSKKLYEYEFDLSCKFQKVMQSASRLLGLVVGSTCSNLKQGSTYIGGLRSIQTSSAASMPIKVN